KPKRTVVVTGAFIVAAAVPRLPAQQARGARRARRSAVASNPLSRGAGGAARGAARAPQARGATGAERRGARVAAAPRAAARRELLTERRRAGRCARRMAGRREGRIRPSSALSSDLAATASRSALARRSRGAAAVARVLHRGTHGARAPAGPRDPGGRSDARSRPGGSTLGRRGDRVGARRYRHATRAGA